MQVTTVLPSGVLRVTRSEGGLTAKGWGDQKPKKAYVLFCSFTCD